MINVSEEWKKLHQEPLLPETFVEIRLDVTDVNVGDLVSIAGNNEASFSNPDVIVNGEANPPDERYALLEHNLWSLDGSRKIVSDLGSYEASGFVSKNGSASGLTITLSEIRSNGTPGFIITWSSEYGEYATNFTIDVKLSGSVIASTTIEDNTENVIQVELPVGDYDGVTITANEWSVPNHRMRIDGITFGCALIFTKSQILSYSHEQTGDPLGSEISKNSIQFSLDNTDGRWDLLNPHGFDKYLYERQPLKVRYGMQTNSGVEWIQAGTFYLTEWRAPGNGLEATFVARDAFEFILNTQYSRKNCKGVVKDPGSNFKNQVVDDGILVFSELEGIYKASGTVTATLPIGTEVTVYDRARHNWSTTGYYNAFRIDQGWICSPAVSLDNRVLKDVTAAIDLCAIPDVNWEYGSRFEVGECPVIIEDVPVGQLIQLCVNKCAYSMWQAADGKLRFNAPTKALTDYVISSGSMYTHPEIELTKPLKQVSVVCYDFYGSDQVANVVSINATGETVTIDNPYMWKNTSFTNTVSQAYAEWWKHRGFVSGEYRADPRLELFDVIKVESKYGLISPVMVTQIKYTYNGSFHGVYKGKILSADILEETDIDGEVTSDANS